MLNRIGNITAGSDFKSAVKPQRANRFDRSQAYHVYDGHDSINISPAYNFLVKHNWQIKELYVEDEKLFIDFFLTDFEFITTIPLKQINQMTTVEYKVLKEKELENVKGLISVEFLANLSKINYDDTVYHYNLSKLEILFNRLMHLKLKGEIISTDRRVIEGLLDGLAEGLQEEFDLINNGLFIFIDKYFNIRLNGSNSKISLNNSVFVTRIRPYTQIS